MRAPAGLAVIALLVAGCSAAVGSPVAPAPPAGGVPGFSFGADTFAFRNDIRSRDPRKPGLYAN